MKRSLLQSLLLAALVCSLQAQSNISTDRSFLWQENVGWLNWRPAGDSALRIDEYVCAGFIYGANIGWINFGDGAPANDSFYQNQDSHDFGVNVSPRGELRGFAYAANIGWMNFDASGQARVNLQSGKLEGRAYAANIGWIEFDQSDWFIQVDHLAPGMDTDLDGIPDAWELRFAGDLNSLREDQDQDQDGQSDLAEYMADTDPFDPDDLLKITSLALNNNTQAQITWTSKSTRIYQVHSAPKSNYGEKWSSLTDKDLSAAGPETTFTWTLSDPEAHQFFRVFSSRPLAP